jgi:flagellar biosynthesis chaperone FliJ
MTSTAILKRIDNVEIQLTPKEWAIRLTDEFRKYPTENEFYRSLVNYSSEKNTPFIKPFYILNKRAKQLHSGHKPEDIRTRHQIGRKLRAEYQTLKTLMLDTNEKIKHKVEIWKLKAYLQSSIMKSLMLQDIIAIAEVNINGSGNGVNIPELGFPSMIKEWRSKTFFFIVEFYIYDAVVKTIQDKYFDGHSFIYRNIEANLLEIETTIKELVLTFNEYLEKMQTKIQSVDNENETINTTDFPNWLTLDIEDTRKRLDHKSIISSAEKWAKDAKDKTTVKFLDEMGKHDDASGFLWNLAREEAKVLKEDQNAFYSVCIES